MDHRKLHLDFLRIFAIILVVFNHTPAYSFPFSAQVGVSWTEFFMICTSIADKVAVPLFFMISGALLLAKNETLSSLLKKRVLRIFYVLVIFLFAQNSIFYLSGILTLKQAAYNILLGKSPAYTTWFLYGYLAFLLMLPLLRLLIEKMEAKHFLYLVVLHFITVEFVPVSPSPLEKWLPFTAHCDTLSNIYLYAFIGYFLEHRISIQEISKKALCILAAASICAILIGATLTLLPSFIMGTPPSQTPSHFTGAVLIPCILIYLVARKLGELSSPKWIARIITLLGSGSFTVMLTENIFRLAISAHIPGYHTEYFPCILVTLMVCCCGWFCGIIAKRIPVISNLV